ncbi:MAG: ISNCY family transposase [Deltaproteobacteria bacterium]|nr:MAG: ISNCY family transposase [Deltaproteobacteria bacterium]
MGGHLLMSEGERLRKVILEGIRDGRVTLKIAALRLGVTYRQLRRIWKRFQDEGDPGLIHRGRGRPSNRSKPVSLRHRAIRRYRERYEGFGPTLACEKLAQEGIVLDHETFRRWLIEERLWAGPKVRVRHRAYRERKARFGEMLQLDGSQHRWFGRHEPEACLMNMVDDATGRTLSLMTESENLEGAMRLLWHWIERYGVPVALYTDRHTIYRAFRQPTLQEDLAGEEPLSSFGRACKKLGIAILTAHSPQAKGRVERKHGVFQDRFLKELALQGITTIAAANTLLQNGFVEDLNRRFAVPPADPGDAHRPLAKRENLAAILCQEKSRTVSNDFTVRYEKRWYQITRDNRPLPKPRSRVTVRTLLDGTMELWQEARRLAFEAIPIPTQRMADTASAAKPRPRPAPPFPGPNHPWRARWKTNNPAAVI